MLMTSIDSVDIQKLYSGGLWIAPFVDLGHMLISCVFILHGFLGVSETFTKLSLEGVVDWNGWERWIEKVSGNSISRNVKIF